MCRINLLYMSEVVSTFVRKDSYCYFFLLEVHIVYIELYLDTRRV